MKLFDSDSFLILCVITLILLVVIVITEGVAYNRSVNKLLEKGKDEQENT